MMVVCMPATVIELNLQLIKIIYCQRSAVRTVCEYETARFEVTAITECKINC